MYKEYVLALLLCCNICTSISPTSTHQPKTHATHTHTHTHVYIYTYICVRVRARMYTHIFPISEQKQEKLMYCIYIIV